MAQFIHFKFIKIKFNMALNNRFAPKFAKLTYKKLYQNMKFSKNDRK